MSKTIKTAATVAIAGTLALCGLAACGNQNTSNKNTSSSNTASNVQKNSNSTSKQTTSNYVSEPVDAAYATGEHTAVLTVDGYDPIEITLYADSAPVTVSNFCSLANSGFYDGLTFYRFVDGFCMQGGSSNNSAATVDDGNSKIVGEFKSNGHDNALADKFGRGTVAMARSSDPNSATTTFFVTLDDSQMVSQSLDGKYAAFGTIDESDMKTVDKIVSDYMKNVNDVSSGAISDVDKQAKITSVKITK